RIPARRGPPSRTPHGIRPDPDPQPAASDALVPPPPRPDRTRALVRRLALSRREPAVPATELQDGLAREIGQPAESGEVCALRIENPLHARILSGVEARLLEVEV